jgi:hypothetical protein
MDKITIKQKSIAFDLMNNNKNSNEILYNNFKEIQKTKQEDLLNKLIHLQCENTLNFVLENNL